MNRVIFFVDGFNLYHALDTNPNYHKYKWLDLSKLANCYVTTKDKIEGIYYFTALTTWSPEKVGKHKNYIRALESRNIQLVYGQFKKKSIKCYLCGKTFRKPIEKQTDVNIAIHLLQLAVQDRYDTAMIISGDSDLIPSINAVHTTFPTKKIGIVIPIGRASESLKQTSDFHMRMKEKHLKSSRFEKTIEFNNEKLVCPSNWC